MERKPLSGEMLFWGVPLVGTARWWWERDSCCGDLCGDLPGDLFGDLPGDLPRDGEAPPRPWLPWFLWVLCWTGTGRCVGKGPCIPCAWLLSTPGALLLPAWGA